MSENESPTTRIIHQAPQDLTSCLQKVRQLSNCIEIANLMNSELSLGRLLSNVMETVTRTFQADSASLLLEEEETGDLVFQIALGDVGHEIKEIFRLEKGKGIAGLVAQTGKSVNIEDAYTHPSFSPEYDLKTHYRTRSMLCVPLKAWGKTLGVIQVMNKQTPPFIFSKEELEMLETIGSSAAVAIDTARMHRLIIQKETLERDLALAREVQQSFLPFSLPTEKDYDFFGINRPALEIGGDFYNFFKLPDQRIGIVLGDVSGKGISAALFMARLTSDIQYQSLWGQSPGQLLGTINTLLCQRTKHGMFVTLLYLILDPGTGEICFSNAGHLNPLCVGGKPPFYAGSNEAKGLPLGIIPDLDYASQTLTLEPGQALVLYTDGVTEAQTGGGGLFGQNRLIRCLAGPAVSASHLIRSILSGVDKFTLGQGGSDDITLVAILRKKHQP